MRKAAIAGMLSERSAAAHAELVEDDDEGVAIAALESLDVLVYFSHHMVTLPPPGWVHAAHSNGVHPSPGSAAA
jgi:hypothetical protein